MRYIFQVVEMMVTASLWAMMGCAARAQTANLLSIAKVEHAQTSS